MSRFQFQYYTDFIFRIDNKIYRCNTSSITSVSPVICAKVNESNLFEYTFTTLKDPNGYFSLFINLLDGVEIDISFKNAPFLYEVANILQIQPLVQATLPYMKSITINQSNVFSLLELFATQNLNSTFITNFIIENWNIFERSEELYALSVSSLECIFSNPNFNPSSETALFDMIYRLSEKDQKYSVLFQFCDMSQLDHIQVSKLIDIISLDSIPPATIESLESRFVQITDQADYSEEEEEELPRNDKPIEKVNFAQIQQQQQQQIQQQQQQIQQMQQQQYLQQQQQQFLLQQQQQQQMYQQKSNVVTSHPSVSQPATNNNNYSKSNVYVVDNESPITVVHDDFAVGILNEGPKSFKYYESYDEDEIFSGCINYIKTKRPDNWSHYILTSCGGDKVGLLSHLFDYEEDPFQFHWDNFSTKGIRMENAWITLQFPYHKIMITDYTLGVNVQVYGSQPKSWKLEGSNDMKSWEQIAFEKNSKAYSALNASNNSRLCTFRAKVKKAFSCFRFVFTDNYAKPTAKNANEIRLTTIEFYGTIYPQ